jgi:hypothetical protein
MLCTLITSLSIPIVKADAAPPPDPTVGGVSPYQPQETNVQMMSETVFIDVPASPLNLEEPKQIKVHASFTMRNQGQTDEQMQVIFPLSRLGHDGSSEQALYKVKLSSFAVKVNGQPVSITELTTPPEESGYEVPEVLWAAFDASFPVDKDVLLQVEYEMVNKYGVYGEGFTGISYILETGAGWYGNIISADITLRLPYSVTEEAIQWANPGYLISGREMRWKLENFEPTREDNLEVGVIHVDVWQAILEQRAKIKVNPKDADAWAKLGDLYKRQAIFVMELHVSVTNSHFMQLAIEARQKAVDLQPEWGDAHFKLAEILWYSNPATQGGFLLGGGNPSPPDLKRDDPAVQKVLYELQQAEIYGTTDDHIANTFYQQITRTFPELKPTPSVTVTVPTLAPTETPFPTVTDIPSPSASPTFTLVPSVTSTPVETRLYSSPNNNVLLIAGLGLIALGGVSIYLLKSK